ncbi:helitron_like_N domain-containing protein [Trichonephila clavipes]|nr:helitron_like_N domain-containing protein [Trichonephila clavipes]
MMVRRNNFNLFLRCRLLLHQFLMDMYVKVESERLRFIALNQTKLRAENYIHLQDAIRNDSDLDPNNLGQMVIFPLLIVNSARYLHEYTQDAFIYLHNYGRPDLFITMTCNYAWPEITLELIPGQNSTDKHDLTARVFKVKLQKLVALLTKGKVVVVAEWYRYRIVAGFVTSSSPVPQKTRRVGQRCTLNLSRAEMSSRWCGVVVRRGGASSGVIHVT